jgi:hypothetical protein
LVLSRVNSFFQGATTGRRDGFRAAEMHPAVGSSGTVTKVYLGTPLECEGWNTREFA